MKDLNHYLSPISLIFFIVAGLPCFILLFEPTLLEYSIFLLVDFLFAPLFFKLDGKLFIKYFPIYKPIFPKFESSKFAVLSQEKQIQLVEKLMEFPRYRSLFAGSFSILKMVPANLVLLFYWEYDYSVWVQLLKLVAIDFVLVAYFTCSLYTEYHITITKNLEALHKYINLSEVFRKINIPYKKNEFLIQENISLFVLAFMFLALVSVSYYTLSASNHFYFGAKIFAISVITLILVLRVYFVNRRFLFSGLDKTMLAFEKMDFGGDNLLLPINSNLMLAKFDQTFNKLNYRLAESKEELVQWLYTEAQESRLKTLGEISGLILHDLSTPLHVVNFCVEEINTKSNSLENREFKKHLYMNLERANYLVESLRSFLRNNTRGENSAEIRRSFEYVKNLLGTQFRGSSYFNIHFNYLEKGSPVSVDIPSSDLIHILYNLMKNSVENLMLLEPTDPTVEVIVEPDDNNMVSIRVSDNGSGLSMKDFNSITQVMFRSGGSQKGLGLRLIKRLIEFYGGQLTLEECSVGTSFRVSIGVFRRESSYDLSRQNKENLDFRG